MEQININAGRRIILKRILCWDWEICHNNWWPDIKETFEELELEYCFNEMCPVDINMCFEI